jgi:RNA polymerase sigma factor (sigma-70 family)
MGEALTTTQMLANAIQNLHSNHDQAWEELLDHACGRLRQMVEQQLRSFPRVHRWEGTGDVLQNVLLRLQQALRSVELRDVRHFLSLSSTLIRRELLDLIRHYYNPEGQGANHASHTPSDTDGGNPAIENAASGTHGPATAVALLMDVHEQVERLPEELRQVVDLLWYQGLSRKDAAAVAEVSTKTISRRWLEAREKLGSLLEP